MGEILRCFTKKIDKHVLKVNYNIEYNYQKESTSLSVAVEQIDKTFMYLPSLETTARFRTQSVLLAGHHPWAITQILNNGGQIITAEYISIFWVLGNVWLKLSFSVFPVPSFYHIFLGPITCPSIMFPNSHLPILFSHVFTTWYIKNY